MDQLTYILYRSFYEVVRFHACDRACHIALALSAVTDHHNFLEELIIFFQGDVEGSLALSFYFFGSIANEAHDKHCIGFWNLNAEVSIDVGNCTDGLILFQNNGGTNHRFPRLILYITRKRVLGKNS